MSSNQTLDELRAEFGKSRMIAMPIAGTIAWTATGICGAVLPLGLAAWALFICTGMTFGLAVLIAPLVGEDLLGRKGEKTELDDLFLLTILMANLAWAIAIPFFMVHPSSLPLSVGILAGLMWVPFSWMIRHWIGLFHGIARAVLVVAAWYLFPAHRFVVIPAIIVVIYLISIYVLATRPLPIPVAGRTSP
jgi:hypothetical protein